MPFSVASRLDNFFKDANEAGRKNAARFVGRFQSVRRPNRAPDRSPATGFQLPRPGQRNSCYSLFRPLGNSRFIAENNAWNQKHTSRKYDCKAPFWENSLILSLFPGKIFRPFKETGFVGLFPPPSCFCPAPKPLALQL